MKKLANDLTAGDTVKYNNKYYTLAQVIQGKLKNGTPAKCCKTEINGTFCFWFKNTTTVIVK